MSEPVTVSLTKETGERIRRYEINPEMLGYTCQTGQRWEVINGIPKGAKIKGFRENFTRNVWCLFVEHPDFDIVNPGEISPCFHITIKSINSKEGE